MGLSSYAELSAVSCADQLAQGDLFDLEAALAQLPPWGTFSERDGPPQRSRGQAGVRLREHLRVDLPEDLLRETARDTLGALRCSHQYLDALCIVLGNQAHAERCGYLLEMNVRVPFTSERTMRTILDQMADAGITFRKQVSLGQGRAQVVHCFRRRRASTSAAGTLEAMYRQAESPSATAADPVLSRCVDLTGWQVPY